MGALHAGHISLLKKAKSENDLAICSIFVNPSQFNDPKDFTNYPRRIDADSEMLEKENCDVLFIPDKNEVYPSPDSTQYELGEITKVLEGKFREGHFNGVASVVKRLLELVQPDRAYFGRKDYQQLLVVKTLVRNYNLNVDVIGCDIIREPSGLAMSSRNQLLSNRGKETASHLSASLFLAQENYGNKPIADIIAGCKSYLREINGIELEYFEIAQSEDLKPLYPDSQNNTQAIALLAARVENIRLIDNMLLT